MIAEAPMISIIMNCYNCDRFLEDAIDSVYAQTFTDWEIIFWDNASLDKSSQIAKKYDSKLKYFCAKKTTPLGEARNIALQKANGKYICFLDCDDLYLKNKLEKQFSLMEKSQYAMSYGSTIVIDEYDDKIRNERAKYNSGYILEKLLYRYDVNMLSVMIRRSILIDNDLSFLPHLQYCPDYNLFMEIASRYPIGVLPDYIVKYRVLSNSLSRKTLHLVSTENKYTLDHILERDKKISIQYPEAVKAAYSKLHYYNAINFISKDMLNEAKNEIKTVLTQRWEYIILYILLHLHLPKKYLLRLLKR